MKHLPCQTWSFENTFSYVGSRTPAILDRATLGSMEML
jgi:hypothetical protein